MRFPLPLRSLVVVSSLSLTLLGADARAESVLLTCPGTQATHYTPGLTFTPRLIHFTSSTVAGPCVGLPLTVTSLRSSLAGQGTLDCLAGSADVVLEIEWSDGTSSHAEGSNVLTLRPGGVVVVVEQSTVVSGRFLGATLTRTVTLLQTELLACATEEGVTDVAGPVTYTVTGL